MNPLQFTSHQFQYHLIFYGVWWFSLNYRPSSTITPLYNYRTGRAK